MKSLVTVALLTLVAYPATAQTKKSDFAARAMIVAKGESPQAVWITAASKTGIRYKETEVATKTKDARIRDFETIFFFEPTEFSEAEDLFQDRKYEEAKAKFAGIKAFYQPVSGLRDNHSTRAAFYEMECMRKLNDLDGLSAALKNFDKSALTREYQLRQLELYVIWDAARSEAWDQVLSLVEERKAVRLPGFQRVQLAYLQGMALEAKKETEAALTAYAAAMSLDVGASEVIARDSALRSLAMLAADEGVKQAIAEADSGKENKNSRGYAKLLEAASIATLYELSLGQGVPLPADYKVFLKFQPKAAVGSPEAAKEEPEAAKPAAKEEVKKAPKKTPKKKAAKKK